MSAELYILEEFVGLVHLYTVYIKQFSVSTRETLRLVSLLQHSNFCALLFTFLAD